MRDTAYFEIDETTDSRIGKYVQVEDINKSSDIKVPAGVKYRDTWSMTENDESVLLYLYLKEIVLLCVTFLH